MLSDLLLRPIPEGRDGIIVTLQRMAVLAREGIRNEKILSLSRSIVRPTQVGNKMAEASAIFNWVVSNIRYVKDPVTVEFIMSPLKLLEVGSGDCDDLSILIAALLESIGIPARFVAVKTILYNKLDGSFKERPGFNHVYPEGWIDGHWIIFDAASASPAIGKTTPSSGEKLIQPVTISEESPPTMDAFQNTAKLAVFVGALALTIFTIWIMFKGKKGKR